MVTPSVLLPSRSIAMTAPRRLAASPFHADLAASQSTAVQGSGGSFLAADSTIAQAACPPISPAREENPESGRAFLAMCGRGDAYRRPEPGRRHTTPPPGHTGMAGFIGKW
jgi:hypothetical protein